MDTAERVGEWMPEGQRALFLMWVKEVEDRLAALEATAGKAREAASKIIPLIPGGAS